MYNSAQVANYFLKKSFESKALITPMKLQKLVYFAHGWYLAQAGVPLLDEQIEAWQFGPVVPNLYHATKAYGNNKIESFVSELNGKLEYFTPEIPEEDITTRKFLDAIWNVYSQFTANQLSNMTHVKGSPWSQVIEQSGNVLRKNTDISDELIKEYFVKMKPQTAGNAA